MADNFQNEKYLTHIVSLGPAQSLVLTGKLMTDVHNFGRVLSAPSPVNVKGMLNEPNHVLTSLADVADADVLYGTARIVNGDGEIQGNEFLLGKLKAIVSQVNLWLNFLKINKMQCGQAL